MSRFITLEEARKQLNIDEWFTDDDMFIESLIDASEEAVITDLDCDIDTLCDDNGGELPKPIIAAMMLLIGGLYRDRENTSLTSITENPSYRYLLNLYHNYNNTNN